MMRAFLFIGIFCLGLFGSRISAQAVNAQDIAKLIPQTQDSTGNFYYPKLLKRFLANDTTLTDQDIFMLKLGATQTPDYSPYATADVADSARKSYRAGDYGIAIQQYLRYLEKQPLDVDANWSLAVAFKRSGDMLSYQKYRNRTRRLFEGLLYTGDGLSEKSAFVVTSVAEEYSILEYLGYESGEQALLEGKGHSYDLLKATKLKDNTDKNAPNKRDFYFNIDLPFGSLGKELEGK